MPSARPSTDTVDATCTGMGLPLRRRRTNDSSDLSEVWAELRTLGYSYREIGEMHGYSHERVRQVIGHLDLVAPAELRRQQTARKIADWLHLNGPAPLGRLVSELGVNERSLTYLARKVPGVIPLHLVVLNPRPTVNQYSRDDLLEALREVAGRVPATSRSQGMSHTRYDKHRRNDQPSAPLVINRFGGWEAACDAAGVASGRWTRPKETYASKWTEADLLESVAEYARHAAAAGAKPTYTGYDKYQQDQHHLPSGTTVRNRMRSLGVGTWPEILDLAMRQEAAA